MGQLMLFEMLRPSNEELTSPVARYAISNIEKIQRGRLIHRISMYATTMSGSIDVKLCCRREGRRRWIVCGGAGLEVHSQTADANGGR